MPLSSKNGVILDQQKEPALSREILSFLSASTLTCEKFEPLENTSQCDLDTLIKLANRANIIDERDGRSLAQKLERWKKRTIRAVVCDAIDDEPYVSSQICPLLHRGKLIAEALNLAADACGAKERYIVVYKNMYDLGSKIPSQIENVRVERLGGKYPMEIRAAKNFEKDVLLIGACALMHLYRAAAEGLPQTTAIVTVAGNCVGNPANLEVTIGTTLTMVLERCGLIKEPTYIVEGGAMKGLCVIDPDHTVIKADTRAVLAFHEDRMEQRYNCIGCGRCVEACPAMLNPNLLYKAVSTHRLGRAALLGAASCTGCSTCSYVCPSKLDLSHTIFSARSKLLTKEGAKEKIEA